MRPMRPLKENVVRGMIGSTELDFMLDTAGASVYQWSLVVVCERSSC